MGKTQTLKIYKMRDGYVEFLHSIDRRVQFNKGERRPYVGIVITVGGHDYFVPMESPKPQHEKIKAGIHIMKIDGGKLGLLGFNNMIPAKMHYLIEFDIEEEPDPAYRNLLQKQLVYFNSHKREIHDHAWKTYEAVKKKRSPFFERVCCDFAKLEAEYTKYYYKTVTY